MEILLRAWLTSCISAGNTKREPGNAREKHFQRDDVLVETCEGSERAQVVLIAEAREDFIEFGFGRLCQRRDRSALPLWTALCGKTPVHRPRMPPHTSCASEIFQ